MSQGQEIQLSSYGRGPAVGVIEPWAAGTNTGLATTNGQATPLRKIHRLLRGRYVLCFVLAILGAAAGGIWGYTSQQPTHGSFGYLEIGGIIPDPNSEGADKVMAMYNHFMQSQVARIMGERVIKNAFDEPAWKRVRKGDAPTSFRAFSRALKVDHVKNTYLIKVSFSDPDPDVAPAACEAVIRAYEKVYGKTSSGIFLQEKIGEWTRQRADAERARDTASRELDTLVAKHHFDDLTDLVTLYRGNMLQLKATLDNLDRQLAMAKAAAGNPQDRRELTAEEVAQLGDRTMQGLLADKDEAQMQRELLINAGPRSLQRQRIDTQIAAIDKSIGLQLVKSRERYRKRGVVEGPNGEALIPRTPAEIQHMITPMRAQYEGVVQEAQAVQEDHMRMQKLKKAISAAETDLNRANEQLERLRFQQELAGRVDVIAYSTPSEISTDARKKYGLVGGVAGAALPVGLLLLIGLMNTRYRYSDETGTDMAGITLLGILPNLPDRLSDPEQAAIAAHCVHQIRTMLQINGGSEDKRVFAVTSAAPGDGKTSLTLALGLSYAACGTRTLLIDCDLVGAGLTTRMNVEANEGVLEAISSRSLLEYVRTTDVADVAILPVGSARAHHASTLSPSALRRMISEAQSHFEVIMIDTGPILGSIEASMVCAAADGVILAVSRGQQRPLVEKSLAHLAAIGARLAGVVFNRAQTSDFERSISGISLRGSTNTRTGGSSVANGNGHNAAGATIGPVARAVASQNRSN